jgi:SET domain-containing protein
MIQKHPGLYYAPSGKHRYGMYCTEPIDEESVIEICPVLLLTSTEAKTIDRSHTLYSYYFEWTRGRIAIALGYGSLYNHSKDPNAYFDPDYKNQLILFKAHRHIAPGEEILVDYHAGNPDEEVWFEVQ